MAHLRWLLMLIAFPLFAPAQNALRHDLNPEVGTYLKASVRAQLWGRYTELNPGSLVYGEATSDYFDVSVRRFRINMAGQLSPQLYVYAGLGDNNLSYRTSRDFRIRVLDLYAEYQFHPALAVGLGKSGYHGLSRLNLRSSRSMLGLDAPLFSLYSVNRTDDLGRNLGLWAKGQAGRWDYRLVLNNPLRYDSGQLGEFANWANLRPRPRLSFYVKHQFYEQESNRSAFGTGTYLGKKQLFNLGAGLAWQPRAMWSAGTDAIRYHDMLHFALDAYLEQPLSTERDDAVTLYLGYFDFDFGPGYLRNVGANNPATGLEVSAASFNGTGAAFPMIGTGRVLFGQAGYLLPSGALGINRARLQPHASAEYAAFSRLSQPMLVYELGFNLLFDGHRSKMTLGAQHRPIYEQGSLDVEVADRMWMVVLQYQVEIN